MNFVDTLLENVTPATIHQTISDIAEIWNTVVHGLTVDSFAEHPQYIKDLVHILNFDAVCLWDGLDDFVSRGDKRLFDNTVRAFTNIGFTPAVEILRAVFNLEEVRDFYNKRVFFIKIQTLNQIAGLERGLAAANYTTSMWAMLERYVLKGHLAAND